MMALKEGSNFFPHQRWPQGLIFLLGFGFVCVRAIAPSHEL